MEYIEGQQTIFCKVNPDELETQMSFQVGSKPVPNSQPDIWKRCWKDKDALSRPFSEKEVNDALDHASSAPGPDGWTYRDLAQLRGFVPAFTSGLHQLAASGTTPDSWRNYKSLLLFKKPKEFQEGMDMVLKNFRPIALSNVTYKLLTSMLSKRMSSWLEKNEGVSHGQRAAFSRRGIAENTLIVAESLRAKKGVLYLDLSDAFNGVEHSVIFEALRQSQYPDCIVGVIMLVYTNCSTQPTDLTGKPLCGPVKVPRGVRQGCPLSSILFNLVLDPVVRSGETTTSFCLGYMDDLVVVLDDPSEAPQILQSIVSRAQSLGFTFNPDKCGAANIPSTLSIGVVPVPVVTEERAHKYLGTPTFPGMMGGLEACF